MDKLTYLNYSAPGALRCGSMHPEHFRLLMALSGVHSTRIIMALEDYLVHGTARRDACRLHGVSASYMTTVLQKLQSLNQMVASLSPWYAAGPVPRQATVN